MNLVFVGINHRTAPLDIREKIWLSSDETRRAVTMLREKLFEEVLVISTCNRTEVYGVLKEESITDERLEELSHLVISDLCVCKSLDSTFGHQYFHTLHTWGAIRHLFKVATGIDSLVMGDIQILSQVKEAFAIAEEQGTAGTILRRLKQSALHAAKRARTETSITEGAVSVSYAAVELAGRVFSDLTSKVALLVGAGETGELTARHLSGKGTKDLLIANRTHSKAEELAASIGGRAIPFSSLKTALSEVDVVITSVTADYFVLTKDDVRTAMKARSNRPLILIDIGVPRNVDPAINTLDTVFLYDIDALKEVVDQNLERRKTEIPKVNSILLQELSQFHEWVQSMAVGPTIAQLRERFEEIRREEIAKHVNRFAAEDRELLELVSKRIVNKLLHDPTMGLRNGTNESREENMKMLQIVRELFGLKAKPKQPVEEGK